MHTLRDTFGKLVILIGTRASWRWWLLLAGALVVTLLEVVGAALVYALISLIAGPVGTISVPLFGDLTADVWGLSAERFRVLAAALVGLFFLARAVTVVANAYLQSRLLSTAGAVLASRLLRGYLAMPYLQHTKRATAELVRNTYDATQQVTSQVLSPLVTLVSKSILATGLLTVMALTAPLATALAVLLFTPAVWLLQAQVQPRLKQLGREAQTARTGSLAAIQQSLGAIRDIKLLDSAADFAAAHAGERVRLAQSQYRARTLKELPRALTETVLVLTIVLILVVALLTGTAGDEAFATLGLFAYAGLRLQPALQQLVRASNELRFGSAILDDLVIEQRELSAWLRDEREARGRRGEQHSCLLRDEIRLTCVRFRYDPSGPDVLRDIELTIPAGGFVGVVGPTGGGKSTLVDVITGLLEPSSGQITIDGHPLGSRPYWWWKQLGVVSQDVFLIDASLRDNIAFGVPAAAIDEERLAGCVARAQLVDVVAGLPQGLDTRVGERGVRLSGGQRQRVAIARALYHDPQVLLLDEGTSALDGATEAALVSAIDAVSTSRTLIAIAHRLSTVRNADMIVVLSDGRVVDRGTYDELLERSDLFRQLARVG